jgi:hypothetical protein
MFTSGGHVVLVGCHGTECCVRRHRSDGGKLLPSAVIRFELPSDGDWEYVGGDALWERCTGIVSEFLVFVCRPTGACPKLPLRRLCIGRLLADGTWSGFQVEQHFELEATGHLAFRLGDGPTVCAHGVSIPGQCARGLLVLTGPGPVSSGSSEWQSCLINLPPPGRSGLRLLFCGSLPSHQLPSASAGSGQGWLLVNEKQDDGDSVLRWVSLTSSPDGLGLTCTHSARSFKLPAACSASPCTSACWASASLGGELVGEDERADSIYFVGLGDGRLLKIGLCCEETTSCDKSSWQLLSSVQLSALQPAAELGEHSLRHSQGRVERKHDNCHMRYISHGSAATGTQPPEPFVHLRLVTLAVCFQQLLWHWTLCSVWRAWLSHGVHLTPSAAVRRGPYPWALELAGVWQNWY